MTVQLPDHFVISHFAEIQIRNFEPCLARRAFAVDDVQMPVDHWPVVQIFIAKESKPMLTDLICVLLNQHSLLGHQLPQQFDERPYF